MKKNASPCTVGSHQQRLRAGLRRAEITPAAPSAALHSACGSAMQTKELEGDLDTGFAATISVLQDEGWQIEVVDKASGIIQAVR